LAHFLPFLGDNSMLWRNRTRSQLLFGSVLGMFGFHFALWAWIVATSDTTWLSLLNHWDANFYSLIVREGYQGDYWAFLPFYPLCVKIFAALTGLSAYAHIAGTLFSSLVFLGWTGIIALLIARFSHAAPGTRSSSLLSIRLIRKLEWKPPSEGLPLQFSDRSIGFRRLQPASLPYLLPQTWLGWFCFVYSPGSFVFHSHHTESLFLLLSFLAFLTAATGRWRWAALLAGLCVATRNQGIFVIFTVALLSASFLPSWLGKLRRFLWSHAISLPFLLAWMGYQWAEIGNPLFSFQVQKNWAHATSLFSVVQTFWFGNAWQNTNLGSILHHIVFFLLLLAAIWLWQYSRIFSLYVVLSLTVMPLQGELVNSFRFGSVLFPAWFLLGDRLSRCPLWLKLGLLTCLIFLNFMVARNYAINHWAY